MLINHMDRAYEEIFLAKIERLLPILGVESLADLGIKVVLMTFSQGMDQFKHSGIQEGELLFMFAKIDQLRNKERTVFERVINQAFHFFVKNNLKLSVS
jgi:hypothetical protein